MEIVYPTDHTEICLYEFGENSIKADIKHNYGKYTFDGSVRENIGYETIVIKSKNMQYAKKRARRYWSMYF